MRHVPTHARTIESKEIIFGLAWWLFLKLLQLNWTPLLACWLLKTLERNLCGRRKTASAPSQVTVFFGGESEDGANTASTAKVGSMRNDSAMRRGARRFVQRSMHSGEQRHAIARYERAPGLTTRSKDAICSKGHYMFIARNGQVSILWCLLLVVMPFATSSVLAPSSKARSY